MDFNQNMNHVTSNVGIPYQDIRWYDIEGQPFGIASRFNAIVFQDANNIIDVNGAFAIGGNFYSPRGMSVAWGRNAKLAETGYSPYDVRFLVGGSVNMGGPLVVVGHTVVGGNYRAASGSTFLIGKDGSPDQEQDLEYLYYAEGGSEYWKPSDKGDHYLISNYDVPRYIPANRIRANLPMFFANARTSITRYKNCIQNLRPNGSVIDNFHEWILRGNDPHQNVFVIDVRPNGLINKGVRAEVPEGSLVIVRFRTGPNAHLQYGLMGEREKVNHTLYVFEDANEIFMEKSADIWGSILAPQAMFHGHQTGGHVSGNVALRAFAVNPNSGFEFHIYPFVGGVDCRMRRPPVRRRVVPEPAPLPIPEPAPLPEPMPMPELAPCPPCPEPLPCPEPPPCPEPAPCPEPLPCPEPAPCPPCPEPLPCPEPAPCPPCPEPAPCPPCPEPIPCPEPCPPCPTCPPCPEAEIRTEYVPVPVRVPCPPCPEPEKEIVPVPVPIPYKERMVCPKPKPCPVCRKCHVESGKIIGCIWGCSCCGWHDWDVKLYKLCNDKKVLVDCYKIRRYGCFEFTVPYKGSYVLSICPAACNKVTKACKPVVVYKNIGVESFIID